MNFIEEGRDKILVKWDNNIVITPTVNADGAVYDKRRGTINAGVLSTLLKNISEDSMLSFDSTDSGVSITIRKYRPINKEDEEIIENKKREYQEVIRKQIEENEAKYRYALKLIEIGRKTFVKIFDNLIIETERRYNGTVIYFIKETLLNQRYNLNDFSEENFLNLICHLKEEYENRELLESNDKKEKVKKQEVVNLKEYDNLSYRTTPSASFTIKGDISSLYNFSNSVEKSDGSVTKIVDKNAERFLESYGLKYTELDEISLSEPSIPKDIESFNKDLKKAFKKENTLSDRKNLYE